MQPGASKRRQLRRSVGPCLTKPGRGGASSPIGANRLGGWEIGECRCPSDGRVESARRPLSWQCAIAIRWGITALCPSHPSFSTLSFSHSGQCYRPLVLAPTCFSIFQRPIMEGLPSVRIPPPPKEPAYVARPATFLVSPILTAAWRACDRSRLQAVPGELKSQCSRISVTVSPVPFPRRNLS